MHSLIQQMKKQIYFTKRKGNNLRRTFHFLGQGMYRRLDASKLEVILWLHHDHQAIYRETTLHHSATRHLEYPSTHIYKTTYMNKYIQSSQQSNIIIEAKN